MLDLLVVLDRLEVRDHVVSPVPVFHICHDKTVSTSSESPLGHVPYWRVATISRTAVVNRSSNRLPPLLDGNRDVVMIRHSARLP